MRSQSCFCLVSVVVAGVVLGGVAGAQSSEPACSMGFTSALAYGLSAKSGPVFSATAKTRFEQRLPDGSYIRAYARTHEARDAAGRAMSEAPRGCRRDENGGPQPEMVVSVFDPDEELADWAGRRQYGQGRPRPPSTRDSGKSPRRPKKL